MGLPETAARPELETAECGYFLVFKMRKLFRLHVIYQLTFFTSYEFQIEKVTVSVVSRWSTAKFSFSFFQEEIS
jgi:hypothetical protein